MSQPPTLSPEQSPDRLFPRSDVIQHSEMQLEEQVRWLRLEPLSKLFPCYFHPLIACVSTIAALIAVTALEITS